MAHPVNILILNHTAGIGGASRSLDILIRNVLSVGGHVAILTPPGPMCRQWEEMGVRVVRWDPPVCPWLGISIYASGVFEFGLGASLALARLPKRLFAGRRLIRRILSNETITVLYINSLVLFPLGWVLPAMRRNGGMRTVWHVRELLNTRLLPTIYDRVVRNIARSSDLVLAITSHEASAFQKSAVVRVIHNTVPADWDDQVSKEAVEPNTLRVGMSCAFVRGKGIPDFVRTARQLRESFPDVRFELFTTRPALLRSRVDRWLWHIARRSNDILSVVEEGLWPVADCVLDSQIRIIFEQPMTLETYRRCHVYVRTDEAGCPWGRDIIEAMWAGIPVVATGSSQEFVLDQQTGFLVPPGNVELLADCVGRLLKDPQLRRDMSRAARERALQLFSPALHRTKLLAALCDDPSKHQEEMQVCS